MMPSPWWRTSCLDITPTWRGMTAAHTLLHTGEVCVLKIWILFTKLYLNFFIILVFQVPVSLLSSLHFQDIVIKIFNNTIKQTPPGGYNCEVNFTVGVWLWLCSPSGLHGRVSQSWPMRMASTAPSAVRARPGLWPQCWRSSMTFRWPLALYSSPIPLSSAV